MKQDVLIIGGGLNGPTMALALAQAGFRVTIVDAQERTAFSEAFDGRAYALALASTKLLSALNVWAAIEPKCQPILEIKASDGRAGEGPGAFFLHFDHAEIEDGPMGYLAEDKVLREALLAAVDAHEHIEMRNGVTVVEQEAGRATLADDSTLNASLIIGCDGRRSGTANRAGIKRLYKDYGQTALVCTIEHEKPHHGVAHQFFLPAGPLAILPLTGGQQSSIVWSETHEGARKINAMEDADYIRILKPRFGDYLGEITLTGPRYTYPLNLSLAETYIAPRTALVGDAAHGIHPIAGQGLNLGFRDIAALAEVLTAARGRGEDIGSTHVLRRYQEWRRFNATAMALGTDTINRLFSNESAMLRDMRRLGMGVVQSLPGLRRRFMREAAGLSGDIPQLLTGKPL